VEKPSLEDLAEILDRASTSKNVSTMKAWLERAGIVSAGYEVDALRLSEVLGSDASKMLGLSPAELEFLLAASIVAVGEGTDTIDGQHVRKLAQQRNPAVRIRGKSLSGFVRALVDKGLLEQPEIGRGAGGARVTARLAKLALNLTDEQLRALVAQASSGMPLSELKPLDEVLKALEGGDSDGKLGEMLAVHLCLMMGLRVVAWRERLPAEIDVTADRVAALTYQRFHIQVKNTSGDLEIDRVDREVGAAAGTGATHVLFVVPRASVTRAARAEILAKSTT
jgi:hypothetical protein